MNRSIVKLSDVQSACPKGSPVGCASELSGYGAEYATEDLVPVRVTLDAGHGETFYFPAEVVAEMMARLVGKKRKKRSG